VFEVVEEVVSFTIRNGVFPAEADDHQPGDIIALSCQCSKCAHQWTPRGARSITDIVDPPL
jgi:hypothetical protein